MKLRVLLIVAAVLAASTSPCLAQTRQSASQSEKEQRAQMQREVREAAASIKTYSAARRTEAMDRIRIAHADLDRASERLETRIDAQWAGMSESSQRHARQALAEIRERRTDLAERTGALEHSSEQAWEQLKAGYLEAYRDLAGAISRASEEFESDAASSEPPATSGKDDKQEPSR